MSTEATNESTLNDIRKAILYYVLPQRGGSVDLTNKEKFAKQLRFPVTMGGFLFQKIHALSENTQFLNQFTDANAVREELQILLAVSPWRAVPFVPEGIVLRTRTLYHVSQLLADKSTSSEDSSLAIQRYVAHLLLPAKDHLNGMAFLQFCVSEALMMLHRPETLTDGLVCRLRYIARFPDETILGIDHTGKDRTDEIVAYINEVLTACAVREHKGKEETQT